MLDFYDPDAGGLEVVADAYGVGLGALLLPNGNPIAFEGKKLDDAQRHWDSQMNKSCMPSCTASPNGVVSWKGSRSRALPEGHTPLLEGVCALPGGEHGRPTLSAAGLDRSGGDAGGNGFAPAPRLVILVRGEHVAAVPSRALSRNAQPTCGMQQDPVTCSKSPTPCNPVIMTCIAYTYARGPLGAGGRHASTCCSIPRGAGMLAGRKQTAVVLDVVTLRQDIVAELHSPTWAAHNGVDKATELVMRP
eukprot:364433-Chlamydomonas_euryale.AAC.11